MNDTLIDYWVLSDQRRTIRMVVVMVEFENEIENKQVK